MSLLLPPHASSKAPQTYFELADLLHLRVTPIAMRTTAHCLDCRRPIDGPAHGVRHANRTGHAVTVQTVSTNLVGDFEATDRAVSGG